KNNIKIHYHGLEDIYLLADYTRLKQSLLNLLSNAIKYNNANGEVSIYARSASPDRVQICIEDNGPGISAQRINELFQPFNRLGAENSKIEGTGIGLTLTRQIVELMNGSIGVESEEAKGSTFWIELPLETNPGHHSPLFHSDSVVPANTESKHASQHSILYVEDNPANLKLVSQIIKKRKNFTLLSAHSAERGLELAFNSKPNLILLDINLPGMNGYEVLQKLRNNKQTENIPIIAITANAMPDDIKRGKTAGFDDYLTKPIEVTVLLRTLDNYLRDNELIS
ncbi:MAG: ATP-binding protein, partial [Gammaproteobacteria bacterium]|nr:ATP-binding protein [Gammaproteobacteria bacterium]